MVTWSLASEGNNGTMCTTGHPDPLTYFPLWVKIIVLGYLLLQMYAASTFLTIKGMQIALFYVLSHYIECDYTHTDTQPLPLKLISNNDCTKCHRDNGPADRVV